MYPGLALADELRRRTAAIDLLFVGPARGIDKRILRKTQYPLSTINAYGLERKISPAALLSVLRVVRSLLQALRIIRRFNPDVVVGFGGYGSFPVVLAARILRAPAVIHEQNAIAGLANRLLSRFATAVAVSFAGTEEQFRREQVLLTGNPVRTSVKGVARAEAMERFGLSREKTTVLVFGGSKGAARINTAASGAYDLLRARGDVQLLHLTGSENYETVSNAIDAVRRPEDALGYVAVPYLDDMGPAYAVADLILSRAGATTIAELTAVGLPSVLVPYPYAVDDHQRANARVLEAHGAARVISDADLTAESLAATVVGLVSSDRDLAQMRGAALECGYPRAASALADLVYQVGQGGPRVASEESGGNG